MKENLTAKALTKIADDCAGIVGEHDNNPSNPRILPDAMKVMALLSLSCYLN